MVIVAIGSTDTEALDLVNATDFFDERLETVADRIYILVEIFVLLRLDGACLENFTFCINDTEYTVVPPMSIPTT